MRKLLPAAALALVASGASAQTNLGNAQPFNAFIFGNASTINGGEIEGPLAVGGAYTVGSFNVNFKASTAGYSAATVGNTSNIGLYVQGGINSVGSTQITDDAYVGSTSGNPLLFQQNGVKHTGVSNVGGVTNFFSPTVYINQSNYLASLIDQTINTSDQNNLNINLNSAVKYGNFKVFSIPASQLAANRTLSIANFAAQDTVLINITGGDVGGFGLTVQGGSFDRILWNNNTASNFTINNRIFEGSLLAPKAAVTQQNVIEGNLIAASLNDTGGNELHFGFGRQFAGTLLSSSSTASATPEPGTVALAAAALISGSLLLRRRKKA